MPERQCFISRQKKGARLGNEIDRNEKNDNRQANQSINQSTNYTENLIMKSGDFSKDNERKEIRQKT